MGRAFDGYLVSQYSPSCDGPAGPNPGGVNVHAEKHAATGEVARWLRGAPDQDVSGILDFLAEESAAFRAATPEPTVCARPAGLSKTHVKAERHEEPVRSLHLGPSSCQTSIQLRLAQGGETSTRAVRVALYTIAAQVETALPPGMSLSVEAARGRLTVDAGDISVELLIEAEHHLRAAAKALGLGGQS